MAVAGMGAAGLRNLAAARGRERSTAPGELGLQHQAHVVLLSLPQDHEPLIGRPLQRVLVDHELHIVDRPTVEVEALALDAPARIRLGAREPAGHEHLDHRQPIRQLGARHPALRHVGDRLGGQLRSVRLSRRTGRRWSGWPPRPPRRRARWRSPRGPAPAAPRAGSGSAACSAIVAAIRLEREESEQLEVALDVAVVGVEPELVEVVRAGALGVEPDVAAFALAELGARQPW